MQLLILNPATGEVVLDSKLGGLPAALGASSDAPFVALDARARAGLAVPGASSGAASAASHGGGSAAAAAASAPFARGAALGVFLGIVIICCFCVKWRRRQQQATTVQAVLLAWGFYDASVLMVFQGNTNLLGGSVSDASFCTRTH